jgi:hypothetical protein
LKTDYKNLSYLSGWMLANKAWIQANHPGHESDLNFWQNFYNQQIWDMAKKYNLNPSQLKGFLLQESNLELDPIKCAQMNGGGECQLLDTKGQTAYGLAQFTVKGMDTPFSHNPNSAPYIQMTYERLTKNGLGDFPFIASEEWDTTNFRDKFYLPYVDNKQEQDFNSYSIRVVDGICTLDETLLANPCKTYGEPVPQEGNNSIELAAQFLAYNKNTLVETYIFPENWAKLSPNEQALFYLSTYNAGLDCVGDAAAIAINAGNVTSWSQVEPLLYTRCDSESADQGQVYGENSMCYASGQGDTSCWQPTP